MTSSVKPVLVSITADELKDYEKLKESRVKRNLSAKKYYTANAKEIYQKYEIGRWSRMTEEQRTRRKALAKEHYENNKEAILVKRKEKYKQKKAVQQDQIQND